ncbi:hypothetical protein HMPREF0208_01202 [Citrobacter koseri]|nr:hypothetical protein HMPREF3220_03832 [Citrobacter koseri]KXA02919.1 hypothetical protein HMPREF3207_02090 [Citrobacter koseri]KXB45608.1 hypothetical protein HMPREF0208_01202 [Citrobacter koseri]
MRKAHKQVPTSVSQKASKYIRDCLQQNNIILPVSHYTMPINGISLS